MTLHAALVRAVRDFNSGRYFEAHEHLEEALEEVEGDQRWELFLALIQVAVGYHKRASGHPGAEKMLGLALEKLSAHYGLERMPWSTRQFVFYAKPGWATRGR